MEMAHNTCRRLDQNFGARAMNSLCFLMISRYPRRLKTTEIQTNRANDGGSG
jgi:hypothetical protein